MESQVTLTVEGAGPVRADRYLFDELSKRDGLTALTRSQIKNFITQGLVRLEGRTVVKAGTMVKPGSTLVIEVPELPRITTLKAFDAPDLEVLYEDDHVIVVNKPPGMVVHPGAGTNDDTLVNALIGRYGESGLAPADHERPGIVHRLDQGTTGVLVVARTEIARQSLSRQFHDHTVTRRYHALVLSTPRGSREISREESGVIDLPIGRHRHHRTMMAIRRDIGRHAVTHWRRLELMAYCAVVELRLETGRTHQIRVHMTHIGSPILGDQTYGDFSFLPPELAKAALNLGRQALHACTLGFEHPATGDYMEFSSPVPLDIVELSATYRDFRY